MELRKKNIWYFRFLILIRAPRYTQIAVGLRTGWGWILLGDLGAANLSVPPEDVAVTYFVWTTRYLRRGSKEEAHWSGGLRSSSTGLSPRT